MLIKKVQEGSGQDLSTMANGVEAKLTIFIKNHHFLGSHFKAGVALKKMSQLWFNEIIVVSSNFQP